MSHNSVLDNVARYAASDTPGGANCYSDGDRSNAPQMPVAAYSDLLFSFATVEGVNGFRIRNASPMMFPVYLVLFCCTTKDAWSI